MSLRIRRGTNADRLSTTFDLGEIAYTTDSKKLYIGDGVTPGGNNVLATSVGTGLVWDEEAEELSISAVVLNTSDITEGTNLYYTPQRAQDAASTLFTSHSDHSGITFLYDDEDHKIIATVTSQGGQEYIEDTVKDMLLNGTHSNISFTYSDNGTGAGVINATVSTNQEYIEDTVKDMLLNGSHSDLSFTYSDNGTGAGVINASIAWPTGTNGYLTINIAGEVSWRDFAISDDQSPSLSGDLDLNYFDITGTGDISLTGTINCSNAIGVGTLTAPEFQIIQGPGSTLLSTTSGEFLRTDTSRFYFGTNTTTTKIYQISVNEPGDNALILRSYAAGVDGNNIALVRSRGTGTVPVAIEEGDHLHSIVYNGYDGTNVTTKSIEISTVVDAPVAAGIIPGKLSISTANRSTGIVTPALSIDSNQTVAVDRVFKFKSYADITARNTAIPTPEAGMVIFLTSTTKLQVNVDGTTGGWQDLN